MNKIKLTKSEYNNYNFIRVMNLPFFFKWFNKLSVPKQIAIGSSCNDKMYEIFGEQNFRNRNEYLTSTWVLEFKSHLFSIITAKGRDTTYEVINENIDNNVVEEFMNYILDTIHIEKIKEYKQLENQ